MPYIFRVIKVGQKADAPHGARLNTTWKNDKQKQIFEAVEDCIGGKGKDGKTRRRAVRENHMRRVWPPSFRYRL